MMTNKRVKSVVVYFDDGTYQELLGASSIFDEIPLRVPGDTYIGTSPVPKIWPQEAPISLYESPTLKYPPGDRANGMIPLDKVGYRGITE
jgi:hypothetical protein